MKRKNIIAVSAIGALGLTSMIIGAATFAANTTTSLSKGFMGAGSGQKMGFGSGQHNNFMDQFSSTGDAEAFRTAVESAIEANNYTAFKAAHEKYSITTYMTEDEFDAMITKRQTQKKIETALENGDYSTWKSLNSGNPILDIITTESQFKQYQEMHTYQEKARTIAETLGLKGQGGNGMHMGMGEGKGMGKGMGMGMGPNNTTTTSQ